MAYHGTVVSFTSEPSDDPGGLGIPVDCARAIQLVILDVDGVLTDAGVYIGGKDADHVIELKRFDILDGLGIKLMRQVGIEVAIVSGRVSPATTLRAQELGIEECHQDPGAAKLPIVRRLVEDRHLPWDSVAMIGDDLPDIPVLRSVGLPVAVANAVEEVMREVQWVTGKRGGHGAVREFAEALLSARGEWDAVVADYLAERTDA